MRRRVVLAIATGILVGTPTWAWAPATHAYLAERITGSRDPAIIFGAMAVDFNGSIFWDKQADAQLKRLTHFEFNRLEPSTFAAGFATHNGQWGADYYAHLYYDTDAPAIYSTRKLRQLSNEFGITIHQAEDSWEGVIEYMIRLEYGPDLGRLIVEATNGPTHEEELVAAFTEPLAQRTGMARDKAERTIRVAAQMYQRLARSYGEVLMMDEPFLHELAILGIVGYLGCGRDEAVRYIERTIELCQDDYQEEMDRITESIGARIRGIPRYAEPCGFEPVTAHPQAVATKQTGPNQR